MMIMRSALYKTNALTEGATKNGQSRERGSVELKTQNEREKAQILVGSG
jgi:hypothetical protein